MALGEGFEFFNKKEQICCEELLNATGVWKHCQDLGNKRAWTQAVASGVLYVEGSVCQCIALFSEM